MAMNVFRCAVVCEEAASSLLADVAAALSSCPEINIIDTRATDLYGGVEALIFVIGANASPATLARIEAWRNQAPGVAILVVIGAPAVADLQALVVAGAYDFVTTPFVAGELVARCRRALGTTAAAQSRPRRPVSELSVRGLVCGCEASARVAAQLPALARCDANVLVSGETGTGKEICAQAIHYLSARASKPWVAVNCGAVPSELVETELFGHVKGAYTTAHAHRAGLVHEAEGGTLFLDDIDCLPLPAQATLLRFLQEREYRPVGSNRVVHADVRVIAASNCNLRLLAVQGAFRQDLYYRLNVLRIGLPPLRERRADIVVLAAHFLQHFGREFSRAVPVLTPAAVHKLYTHDWPGNVRELKHVVERAVLLAVGPALTGDDIDIDDAPSSQAGAAVDSFQSAKSRVIDNFERGYIEQVLVACRGNVTHAALAAKKDRRAFFELMRKHDIQPAPFRSDRS